MPADWSVTVARRAPKRNAVGAAGPIFAADPIGYDCTPLLPAEDVAVDKDRKSTDEDVLGAIRRMLSDRRDPSLTKERKKAAEDEALKAIQATLLGPLGPNGRRWLIVGLTAVLVLALAVFAFVNAPRFYARVWSKGDLCMLIGVALGLVVGTAIEIRAGRSGPPYIILGGMVLGLIAGTAASFVAGDPPEVTGPDAAICKVLPFKNC
jgi:hypothetical protein